MLILARVCDKPLKIMPHIIKFPELHTIISKYYPIGIDRNDPRYEKYQGTVELKNLVADHLNDVTKRSQWDTFIDAIKIAFPELSEVRETRRSLDTCYSVVISINREEIDKFIYEQRLYCRLSFLGNYFCIYGLDYIQVNLNDDNKTHFEPVLTISPIKNYEGYFNRTREIIEKLFPTYRFLNYLYLRIHIDELKITPNLIKGSPFSNVFQALFIPKNITDYIIYGDMRYK